jgi:hypothetical protein
MPERSEEVRAATERIARELDFYEAEARARGLRVERLDEQTLVRKVAGDEANSPFFSQIGWGPATPGGTTTIEPTVHNPDSVNYSQSYLFGHLFFGPANTIQDTDLSLTAVDPRFPRYWLGIGVPANGSLSATFSVDVPPDIAPGVYIANCYLILRNSFAVGQVLQRSCVDLEVR